MNKLALSLMTAIGCLTLTAQSLTPSLMVKENGTSRPLRVSKVNAEVIIHGYVAETKMTMTFENPTNRRLEGELYFPLPEGSTVSGYGLDINGKMIEGVVVEKAKGRQVFEKIVRQKIDPGLVEWTKGNNFKTRVYPLPKNGYRTVMVRYISEINSLNNASIFRLPLSFKEKLDEFSIRLEVVRPATAPQIKASGLANLKFEKWEENFGLEKTFTDLALTEDLVVDLPQVEKNPVVIEKDKDETYFTIHSFPKSIQSTTTSPISSITLFWDASHSRGVVDHEREFTLLRSFCKKQKNLRIDLVVFRNELEKSEVFVIEEGNCEKLITNLKAQPYDGATQLGALKVPNTTSDFCLLFSDGLSNFGKNEPKLNIPVYAISGANSANHAFLRYISQMTGGQYFNLKNVTDEQIVATLGKSAFQFMGAEINGVQSQNCYPAMATPIQNRFAFTGKLVGERATIKLNFGQDGKITQTQTYDLSADKVVLGKVLRTYYAQKMVNELLVFPKQNKEKMIAVGKEYGLVTPGTSLIVLDNVNQYIQHKIEPPSSMPKWCATYKDRMNSINSIQRAKKIGKINRVVTMWKEVCNWHKQSFKVVKTYKGKKQSLEEDDFLYDDDDDFGDEESGGDASFATRERSSDESYDDYGDDASAEDDEVAEESDEAEDLDIVAEEDSPLVMNSLYGARISAGRRSSMNNKKSVRHQSAVTIKAWTPDTPYLKAMTTAGKDAYSAYLSQKEEFGSSPAFYLDCSDFFLKQKNEKLAVRVLSNIAELELENAPLLRVLAHRLVQIGKLELATGLFEEVLVMREEEPQSYRDLALVLAESKKYQRAADLLYQAVLKDWDRFAQIEKILLVELNQIITKAERENITVTNIDNRLKKLIDVDVRIVLNWDADQTDMDLWVTEPSGEKCYYGHNRTTNGGRMSRDFTAGYGPEEYMTKKGRNGKYKIQANYYGSSSQKMTGGVTLQAEVYTNYGRPNEKCQMLTFRLTKGKEIVTVGEIMFGKDDTKVSDENTRSYQIKAGDSLFSIAKKELGSGNRWSEIIKLNQGLETGGLQVGQIINLPK